MRVPLEFPDSEEASPEWTPLEAVVVIKYMDGDGVMRLHHQSTETLNAWEAAGMLLWALDNLRGELHGATEPDA